MGLLKNAHENPFCIEKQNDILDFNATLKRFSKIVTEKFIVDNWLLTYDKLQ